MIVDENGKIQSVYDKIHLFEANIKGSDGSLTRLKESDYTVPGGEFYLPVQTPIGALGTCIVINKVI